MLWYDGLDFYVSQRIGAKRESDLKEHFVQFFVDEKSAWEFAIDRTKDRIETLEQYVKDYKRYIRLIKRLKS